MRREVFAALLAAADNHPGSPHDWEGALPDPNERPIWNASASGIKLLPLSTRRHTRSGARERLRAAEAAYPASLTVRLGAEVIAVEISQERAVAVRYRHAGTLREPRPGTTSSCRPEPSSSPQILMLSGSANPAISRRSG